MDRLNELNPAQREAVTTLSGPLLVLAGAGTGTTRVITYRMAELIRHGVAPNRILSVTFTNKAAREMQERATALLGKRLNQRPVVSTFHSLCVRILREDVEALGYRRHFSIYDRGEQESVARTALRDLRVGKLDVDSNPMTASQFGVRSIPTVLFFKNGEVVDKVIGAVPRTQLRHRMADVGAGGGRTEE